MPTKTVALFLLAALAGAQQIITLPTEERSVTLGAIGDYGVNTTAQADVRDLVESWEPKAIITLGDNSYPYATWPALDDDIGGYYCQWIHPYPPPGISTSYCSGSTGPGYNRFFPAFGNHDTDWSSTPAPFGSWYDYFDLPGNERYYTVQFGSILEVFCVNTDGDPDGKTAASTQGQWLQTELGNSTATWKIVYGHHPPHSSPLTDGTHSGLTSFQWPFKAWGADVVLTGHKHAYERLEIDDFPYIICGVSGKSPQATGPPIAGSQFIDDTHQGALRIFATATALTVQFYEPTGTKLDEFVLP